MRLWPKKKENPAEPENKKTNVFRVTYRLKNSGIALISEIIIKTKAEKDKIKFAEVIKNYWQKNLPKTEFDEIIDIAKIGEE